MSRLFLFVLAACLVASTSSLPLADTSSQTASTKGAMKGGAKGATKGVKAGGKRPATLDSQAGRASASAKGAPQDCKAMHTTQSRRNCLRQQQGAGAAAAHAALPPSPSADGPRRRVYIDAGANWANTLRLYRDIAPIASTQPFEVYAFEASPLITPFLEDYCDWLNKGSIGVGPSSCLPQSGSTAHLGRYASAVGCASGGNVNLMRECMWAFFAKPLAALAPDPRLQNSTLLEERLSVAKLAPAPGEATRYTLIPAGVAAENTHITIDTNPQQLIRGGALTVNAKVESKYVFRVPVVDMVSWILTSFKPGDEVVLKMDVEGAEHEIFDGLTRGGGWDRIDTLVYECHHRRERPCADLMASVRAAAPHVKLLEEDRARLPDGRMYRGIDSDSFPTEQSMLAMVRSCDLGRNVSVGHAGDTAEAQKERKMKDKKDKRDKKGKL